MVDLKKNWQNFQKILKIRPPRENPRSAPGCKHIYCVNFWLNDLLHLFFWLPFGFSKVLLFGVTRGGFLGRPPQGFDPLPTQRVPLCTILKYPYLVTEPKIFLKAPLTPICTNFEGEARAEKRVFLVKIFQKLPKNAFFGLFFFQNFACGVENCTLNQGLFSALGEFKIFVWLTNGKKIDKIFKKFWKSAPLEKILDLPLGVNIYIASIFGWPILSFFRRRCRLQRMIIFNRKTREIYAMQFLTFFDCLIILVKMPFSLKLGKFRSFQCET